MMLRDLDAQEKPDMILPAIFIHNGDAILGGSCAGKVRFWDANDGSHIQVLQHAGKLYVWYSSLVDILT